METPGPTAPGRTLALAPMEWTRGAKQERRQVREAGVPMAGRLERRMVARPVPAREEPEQRAASEVREARVEQVARGLRPAQVQQVEHLEQVARAAWAVQPAQVQQVEQVEQVEPAELLVAA